MISRLLKDHDHILRTLNLLEMLFLDSCRGHKPDYQLMLSIVAYVQDFPERVHHPAEDLVFSLLIKDGEDEGGIARELIKDHTEMEIMTRELRGTIEHLKYRGGVQPDNLNNALAEFLTRQRRHLYFEETVVYPMISKILTNDDWDRIDTIIPPLEDPVFGERTRSDYERLYREIDTRNE